MDNDNQSHVLSNHRTKRAALGRALRRALPLRPILKAAVLTAALSAAALVALSLLPVTPAGARVGDPPAGDPPAAAQLLSDPFKNPPEVTYDAANNRLRMVMQIVSGNYTIPNVGTSMLRQYRSPNAVPAYTPGVVAPGPTLRARLGDTVQVSFANMPDDSKFSYSFVTNSPGGASSFGCDQSGQRDPATGLTFPYPAQDIFPNCYHGSSTANIHYHGTHTDPDGVGDNVLVQVLPQLKQPNWTATFNKMFDTGKIPQNWADLPLNYRNTQMDLIRQYDAEAAAAARRNHLAPPEPLAPANEHMIKAGYWPQYIMGAFPNFFPIPDYDKPGAPFNSGGNGYIAGQAPGTHWYHAHKHGSTALHILNGLAGALIIESSHKGGYDDFIRTAFGWGNTYGQHEKIMVFQQYDPQQNLERDWQTTSGSNQNRGKGIKQVLVNGQYRPTITMQQGEVQLWRLINATVGNTQGIISIGTLSGGLFMVPASSGFGYKQTASDGVQFSPANYTSQPYLSGAVPGGLVLAAGNRADLLVQAPNTPGTYAFKNNSRPNDTLFFVTVTADKAPAASFPTTWAELPKFLADLPPPGTSDIPNPNSPVRFQWEPGRVTGNPTAAPNNMPPHYMINNKQFGQTGEIVDQCMPQDGLQDWVLENWTSVPHPFHIHINPFQILQMQVPTGNNTYNTYKPTNNFIWQDVVAIPAAVISQDSTTGTLTTTPGRVIIRQKYPDFNGTYVLHCHILAHEDRGMMQLVRVVPAGKYPSGCQDAVPEHH
jgi:FtsP/CotA-like multicopper oxidase with cupredoxin domain